MRKGKNYLSIPNSTVEETKRLRCRYLQVACILNLTNQDIRNGTYEDLGISWQKNELNFRKIITPPINNGRYSGYNLKGRSIIRKDLPKVKKSFCHDIYPYGDTSRTPVTATFVRDVWQREEWLPEYLTFENSLIKKDDSRCCFMIKCNEILDIESNDFEFRLLYNINLISENCGSYQIINVESPNEQIFETLYVNWELLPPGHIDINRIIKQLGSKTPQEQIIMKNRFEFLKSFKPKKWIKGTNKFTQYFGVILGNDVVVLENTYNGNALYVFYQDWDVLSKLSRTELIKMNSAYVRRIPHVGKWQDVLKNAVSYRP